MRVIGWLFVVCALACATGVFLPSLQLDLVKSRRTALSLHDVSADRDLARRFVAAYRNSKGRTLGEAVAGALLPRTKGRLHDVLDDTTSAMSSLDEVSEGDVKLLGRILTITIWAYLAMQAAMALLVIAQLSGDAYRRRRMIATVAMAVLCAAISIGFLVACREAAWEANDEIGRHVLGVGPGVYLMTIASVIMLVSAAALLVMHERAR